MASILPRIVAPPVRPAKNFQNQNAKSWHVLTGNALDLLKKLPDNKIHTCVTSPPYFNLREYDVPETYLWGGDPKCQHDWGEPESASCWHCNAWRGSLGRELLPSRYIDHLVQIFREVRRVLHPAGTCWINLGDSYAGSGRGPSGHNAAILNQTRRQGGDLGSALVPNGYKPKDYYNLPSLLGEALRQDGWYLRSKIIWHKTNAKPGSYRDRPVLDYEEILLVTKSRSYYYDYFRTLEPALSGDGVRAGRSVWSFPAGGGYTDPSGGEHYATYPVELPRRCLAAGAPTRICKSCGSPYEHRTEVVVGASSNSNEGHQQQTRTGGAQSGGTARVTLGRTHERQLHDAGYEPACECGADAAVPTVLDPFGGTMTTGVAALERGLRFLGLEAKPEYAELGKRRLLAFERTLR